MTSQSNDAGSQDASEDSLVEEFLHDQEAEGRLDSQGVFTIDVKVARRKLAAFQLSSPESWIVVLVQAAHRGQAKKLTVTQYPRQTTVAIVGARPWGWGDVRDVLDGAETTDGALLSVATAVRALTGNPRLMGFVVEAPDGSKVRWNGRQLVEDPLGVEPLFRDGAARFEVHHVSEFVELNPYLENRGSARDALVAINQALLKSCLASGVPIFVDGRKITGLHLGEPAAAHNYRRPLAMVPVVCDSIPAADFAAALDWEPSYLGGVSVAGPSGLSDSQTSMAGLAVLYLTLERKKKHALDLDPATHLGQSRSRLLFVLDGVVVDETPLSLSPKIGLTAVVSAAGLKTDLSGLKLVRNQELAHRVNLYRRSLKDALTKVWHDTREQGVMVTPQPSRAKVAFMLMGAVGAAVAYPPSLLLWLPAAAIAKARGDSDKRRFNLWDQQLDDELRSLPGRVDQALENF